MVALHMAVSVNWGGPLKDYDTCYGYHFEVSTRGIWHHSHMAVSRICWSPTRSQRAPL